MKIVLLFLLAGSSLFAGARSVALYGSKNDFDKKLDSLFTSN
jgi:hypothetical protein